MNIYYKNDWIKVNQDDERVKELGITIHTGTYIDTRVAIGAKATIDARTVIGADIDTRVAIGARTVIGAGAVVRAGAYIHEGVEIGKEVVIDVIISKYNCNRYFDEKTKTDYIRIGCEVHTLQEWSNVEFQEKLADENDRRWWEAKGRKILNFLMEG